MGVKNTCFLSPFLLSCLYESRILRPRFDARQQTLPMQLDQMREYINNRGWTLTREVEEVRSGAKTRPKGEKFLRMAKRRGIDTSPYFLT